MINGVAPARATLALPRETVVLPLCGALVALMAVITLAEDVFGWHSNEESADGNFGSISH